MKTIIANFKMNMTNSEIKEYFMRLVPNVGDKNKLIVCPPFTALSLGKFFFNGKDISLGAQNICDEEEGKCTGEVSGKMIKDCGADYVIIGHSERRAKFKESGKIINKKIKLALKNRLNVVLCVGEQLADKNLGKTKEYIKNQVEEALKGLYENELDNIIIAYEPVWAIGSGQTPTAKEVEDVVKYIRKVICDDFSPKCEKIQVVYGGSVNAKNCQTFAKIKGVNGLMIGSFCLDVENFTKAVKSI